MRVATALCVLVVGAVLSGPAAAQRRHWSDPPQYGSPANAPGESGKPAAGAENAPAKTQADAPEPARGPGGRAQAPSTGTARDHRLHYTLLQAPARPLPKRIVILPPDVTVKEISAGGLIEKVPKWTDAATANVTQTVNAVFGARADVEIVPLPPLSAADRDLLEEYLGVYFQVAVAAHRVTALAIGGWEHKRERFDYTLGEGLRFLREKTGADAALMVIGEDYVSSGERKAAFVLAAIFGVGIPLGHAVLSAGVVDLANGDLLWMHHDATVSQDLKDPAAVDAMLRAVFAAYPGLPGGPAK